MQYGRYVPCFNENQMQDPKDKILNDWKKFLDPIEVKFHLTCASLFLTSYELLIDSVVKKTKDFFINGYKNGENTYDAEYSKVRDFYKKDIVIASSMWLADLNAIDKDDIEKIKKFKEYRNILAHEMPKIISDTSHDVKTEYMQEIRDLYRKINLWWFTEFEATVNPDLDGVDLEKLNYDEVLSFAMLPMDYMVNIVNDEIKKRDERKSTST
jgi:hypothetical protein